MLWQWRRAGWWWRIELIRNMKSRRKFVSQVTWGKERFVMLFMRSWLHLTQYHKYAKCCNWIVKSKVSTESVLWTVGLSYKQITDKVAELRIIIRKIYVIKSHDVTNECIRFFNCSVSGTIYKRKLNFLTKLQYSESTLCKPFGKKYCWWTGYCACNMWVLYLLCQVVCFTVLFLSFICE